MVVSEEEVTEYLRSNPRFLDHFVQTYVDATTLQTWIGRKHAILPQESHDLDLIKFWKAALASSEYQCALISELMNVASKPKTLSRTLLHLAACAAATLDADNCSAFLCVDDCLISVRPEDIISEEASLAARECRLVSSESGVLALPLLSSDRTVLGVVELQRRAGPFSASDERTAVGWMLLGSWLLMVHSQQEDLLKQKRLQEFLLSVTKSLFEEMACMDKVIAKSMEFAQHLVDADRASLFLVDSKRQELYARLFDAGSGPDTPPQEIRFPVGRGLAGHVALTGLPLHVRDAYQDPRFNRDIDSRTGYRTRSLLCMPVTIQSSVIGVVQMVNKRNGDFTRADEEAFEMFAIYCGLAIYCARLYDKLKHSETKYRVAMELLSYHSASPPEEWQPQLARPIPDCIEGLNKLTFSPWTIKDEDKPLYVIFMFRDLFGLSKFALDDLYRFTLTIRKNYRPVPYHNWSHAFSVSHASYVLLRTAEHKFSSTECLAMFVGCLCHDLDHRGKTNKFMVESASPLAAVYSTSTMEHHHFNQTVSILQQDGLNILKNLAPSEYREVLSNIKHCILATDLARHFEAMHGLAATVEDGIDWDNEEHRLGVMALSMTAADLCSMYKDWDTHLKYVEVIMEEFWQQGDEEKGRGLVPLALMDRLRADELPAQQVGFIKGVCLPCYELIVKIFPEIQPMVDVARMNLERWSQLADHEKEKKSKLELEFSSST